MMFRLVLPAVFFAAAICGEVWLAKVNRKTAVASVEESAFAALGGFRSLAAEIVWFRADRLQDEGRYVELAQLAKTLTLMEPHTPEVWSYAAWNLAYNVSIMMATPEDRWRWVYAGLTLLRDDGLRINPRSAELYRELAWMFQIKIGGDIDSAADVYRVQWRGIVEDVARRDAWEELAMSRQGMSEVESIYGVSDRGDPMYSAIYWAHRGLAYAKGRDRAFLNELIRQTLVIIRNGGIIKKKKN